MLSLVVANGNNVCLVEENVRRHKGGVCEETCVNIFRMLLALILKLCHSGKLTEHGVAVKHPTKLCMRRNVGLYKECIFLFIETASHVKSKGFVGSSAKLCRNLSYGDGVKIHNAVEGLIIIGESGEILDSSEVVTYGKVSRRLNARENYLLIA